MVVCPGGNFFKLPSLAELWNTYSRGDLANHQGVNLSMLTSRGGTLLHEMMHLDDVVKAGGKHCCLGCSMC